MPIPSNKGRTIYSSGPSITQATTVASRTPTVPTQFGIPTMSMDSMFGSIDPRVSEVPEFHPGIDSDDDMSSMSEDADDANPITPFHDVVRNHGGHYMGHTREGKRGEIRKNKYVIPNPKGGSETVELHAHQGGPDYGNVNSITHSGDPEATAPRVNNSPEKLDRNIHAQSYRGAPDRPAKMKPADVRANRKFLESDSATDAISVGSHVRLKPNEEEGFPEEHGVVHKIEKNGTHLVRVHPRYRDSLHDDGFRDVTPDQLEEHHPSK